MERNPLLVFHGKDVVPREKLKSTDPSRDLGPPSSLGNRYQRISTKIDNRLDYIKNQSSQMSNSPDGMTAEKVLVIETPLFDPDLRAKFIDILGVEWLSDAEDDDLTQDSNYMYLSMTNHSALQNLKSWWDKYYEQDGNLEAPYGAVKRLFDRITEIRFWGTKDRIRYTGLEDDLNFRVSNGDAYIPVEVEMWFRSTEDANLAASEKIQNELKSLGAEIYNHCLIPEIRYSVILASVPIECVKSFYDDNADDIDLLVADEVMYFRPNSQFDIDIDYDQEHAIDDQFGSEINEIDQEEPIVALLDGYPISNHEALKGSLIIDDPDDFIHKYENSPKWMFHGTSMASCIINGDASEESTMQLRPLYCRPIMAPAKKADSKGRHNERIPEKELPIDLIHRSVVRMFEGGQGLSPIAPSVKVINLSIGDKRHRYEGRVSPMAKLIDWLSWKYEVLFVISAGNYLEDLDLGVTVAEYESMSAEQKHQTFVDRIKRNAYEKKLLSPAESINSLTVGALHDDDSQAIVPSYLIDPLEKGSAPSPINPTSWGVKKSIKPEVLLPGGRQVYQTSSMMDSMPLVWTPNESTSSPYGIKTAIPGQQGQLNCFGYTIGTSNATALATRKAAMIYETLKDLQTEYDVLSGLDYSVAIKALMVHSADISKLKITAYQEDNARIRKAHLMQYSGYGKLDPYLSHSCFSNQATLIIAGTFSKEEGHKYSFPLPECLNSQTAYRRAVVTLAWKTPVNVESQRHRGIKLWFSPPIQKNPGPLHLEEKQYDWQKVRHGTIQHEILTGDRTMFFQEGSQFDIIVNAKGDSLKVRDFDSIPYTLIVTVETPGVDLPIYSEVSELLVGQRAPQERV